MNDQRSCPVTKAYSSEDEVAAYRAIEDQLRSTPMGSDEILGQLGLFLTRASMARILFMHDLYLKILDVPGSIIELGCHWGQNLALFTTFRTIYDRRTSAARSSDLTPSRDMKGRLSRTAG